MMTLEQFRATGRDVDDLDHALFGVPVKNPQAGRVYHSGLHVYREADGWWTVINDKPQRGELADLEAALYEWALAEGMFD